MIYLATDHAGYDLMQEIIKYLKRKNVEFENVGAFTFEKQDSYVHYALRANKKIAENAENKGIYICGTGIGISIAANRNKNIRAALCHSVEFAKLARFHDDANVLVLPGRFMDISLAKKIIDTFLKTEFEGGRHEERVDALKNSEF